MNLLFVLPSLQKKGPINVAIELIRKLASIYDVNIIVFVIKRKCDISVLDVLDNCNVEVVFSKFNVLFCCFEIIRLLKRKKIDIVHSHCLIPDVMVSFLKHKKITTIHSDLIEEYNANYPFLCGLITRLHLFSIKKFDYPVVISNSLKMNFTKKGFVPGFRVILNGIDLKGCCMEDKILPDRFNILFVGTLDENKNPELLLKAAVYLKLNQNYSLHFLGDGPLKQQLYNKYRDFDFNLTFHGHVDNPSDYYKKSNLFVLCSKREGYGLAYAEALSWGVPTLVSNIDVFQEINRTNSLLHRKFKVESVIDFIFELKSQLDYIESPDVVYYQEIDYKTKLNIDSTRMCEQYFKLYKRCLIE